MRTDPSTTRLPWRPLLAAVLCLASVGASAGWLALASARDAENARILSSRTACVTMAPTLGVVVLLACAVAFLVGAAVLGVLALHRAPRPGALLVTLAATLLLVTTGLVFALTYSGDGSEQPGHGWPTYCSAG
ncbi:hypothetical protein [Actinocatenispora rupis]|uniref:Vitamin K epoxide reductase family protein n=1 Tax=Actinocatenispora rupis TaxID=519421 RepID=A0A8J3J5F5_9ACTN|nr:hypothetical protein [Actinocatenispora rupis]GID16196.1 hypothetical protein Aru02nite_70850 [Actinocatenispora rupis]